MTAPSKTPAGDRPERKITKAEAMANAAPALWRIVQAYRARQTEGEAS